MKRLFLVCVLVAAIPLHALGAEPSDGNVTGGLPEHHAEDPSAAAVTEQNLLASERFWPYQVAATEALPDRSAATLTETVAASEALFRTSTTDSPNFSMA